MINKKDERRKKCENSDNRQPEIKRKHKQHTAQRHRIGEKKIQSKKTFFLWTVVLLQNEAHIVCVLRRHLILLSASTQNYLITIIIIFFVGHQLLLFLIMLSVFSIYEKNILKKMTNSNDNFLWLVTCT